MEFKLKKPKVLIFLLTIVVFSAVVFYYFPQDKIEPAQAQVHDVTYYQSVYDDTYELNKISFDNMAASGLGDTYYTFQLVLSPTLSMYEATKDVKYLERALTWTETMVLKATIIDKQGHRNWSGIWTDDRYSDVPIAYLLEEFQGSTELARISRIILTNPELNAVYGSRAQPIYEFVKDNIVEKHVWSRPGLSWFRNNVTQTEQPLSDKTVLLLAILNHVYAVSEDERYGNVLRELAEAYKDRFESYQGALIWDKGLGFYDQGVQYISVDTSHANRYPRAVTDLYEDRIVFSLDYVQGMARLLTDVIWNQDFDDPMFTNFIDGTNTQFRTRGPWNNGNVYSGWIKLGQYDSNVQEIGEAILEAILAGISNPSLSYMDTKYGRLSLAGHLAKNLATQQTCWSPDLDCNQTINTNDLKVFKTLWGQTGQADLNQDNITNTLDLGIMMSGWSSN